MYSFKRLWIHIINVCRNISDVKFHIIAYCTVFEYETMGLPHTRFLFGGLLGFIISIFWQLSAFKSIISNQNEGVF